MKQSQVPVNYFVRRPPQSDAEMAAERIRAAAEAVRREGVLARVNAARVLRAKAPPYWYVA